MHLMPSLISLKNLCGDLALGSLTNIRNGACINMRNHVYENACNNVWMAMCACNIVFD